MANLGVNVTQKTARAVERAAGATLTAANVMMAVKTADGLLYQATDASGLTSVVGILADLNRANATGVAVAVPGWFWMANATVNPCSAATIQSACYVSGTDGFTVAASGTSNSVKAGTVRDFDATNNFVLVDIGN